MKLASISNLCGPNVTDRNARAELLASAKGVQSGLAGLLSSLQGACADPLNYSKLSELLASVNNSNLPLAYQLTGTAKKAAQFVGDPNRRRELTYAANDSGDNLKMKAIQKVSDLSEQFDNERKADLRNPELFAYRRLQIIAEQQHDLAHSGQRCNWDALGAAEDLPHLHYYATAIAPAGQ